MRRAEATNTKLKQTIRQANPTWRMPADLGATLLFLAVLAEVICQVFWMRAFDLNGLSLAYFLFGIVIALLPLLPVRGGLADLDRKMPTLIWALCWLLPAFMVIRYAGPIIQANPLDYRQADMLPIMQIMGERFLAGQDPYAVIPEIWGGMQPIYLPAMWMAFLPALLLQVDPRWMSVAALLFCLAILAFGRQGRAYSWSSLLVLLPTGILVFSLLVEDISILTLTEEIPVVFFYLILASGLLRRQWVWVAAGLALCMLSRYALAIWAIMYLIYAFMYMERGEVWRVFLPAAAMALVLMLIAGAMGYLDVFLGLQGNYLEAVKENPLKYEPVIRESLGLAKFFPYESLGVLHKVFLTCAVAVPFASLFLFRVFDKRLNVLLFPVCSLKLALVFFFNLLIIPYIYLFYTSTFLSVLLLHAYLGQTSKAPPEGEA